LLCRDKHENIPSWAKSKGKYKRNIQSSSWPKQAKEEKPTDLINSSTKPTKEWPRSSHQPTCQRRWPDEAELVRSHPPCRLSGPPLAGRFHQCSQGWFGWFRILSPTKPTPSLYKSMGRALPQKNITPRERAPHLSITPRLRP